MLKTRWLILASTFVISLVLNVCSVGAEDWPMFRHDPTHTGYTTPKVPRVGNLLWTFEVGNTINSSPTIVDGKVFFGSWLTLFEGSDKSFFCLDAENGQLLWSQDLGFVHGSSSAVVQGKLYVGASTHGKIYALDVESGKEIWSYPEWSDSSPVVINDRVYIGSLGGKLYALNAENGDCLWDYQTGGIYVSSPAVVQGKVYEGSKDGKIYALDAESGNLIWEYQTGGGVDSSPMIIRGTVYIGSINGKLYALDAENGDFFWSYQTGLPVRSTPTVIGDKLFVGLGDVLTEGRTLCLDIENLSENWSYPSPLEYVAISPAVADDKVITKANGKIVCLNADTGEVLWDYKINPSGASPALAYDRVYMSSIDSLYVFGTPPPKVTQPVDNQEVYGTVELRGMALGNAVRGVEVNSGNGWIMTKLTPGWKREGKTTRYINSWTYAWDTRQVSDGFHTLRIRIDYGDDVYSDEMTVIVRVNNARIRMFERLKTIALVSLIVALSVAFLLAIRKFMRTR